MLYAGGVLAAILAEVLVPTTLGLPSWVGVIGLVAGLAFDASAMAAFHRARTNILPHRPADRLVTSGPYALSRNPIYLGNTIAVVGLAVLVSSLWMLGAAVLAAVLTHHLAILREEEHLSARFGPAWEAYARRVPRWLGPIRA